MKLFLSGCLLSFMVSNFAQTCYARLIHQFAKDHHWQKVMAMVAEGHDPDEICEDGSSLLSIACEQKDWKAIETLIIEADIRLPKGMETVEAFSLKPSLLKGICGGIGPGVKTSVYPSH